MKPKQEDPKEMVGGCCVCADENGWTENPLVYCDGQGCNVAVHQACYGIVTVPTGSWFCRKCESQERSARVRCELCPSKDGALKRTDSGGWAHVVCALYIPEVRFGNVTTMEPIMLQLIPPERFNKSCYICEESGKESRATIGACMQCNKTGCKQHFHVICAQAMGLLCEEAGNYLDNVKYCGYCQYHYSKLLPTFQRKGSHVKTIPPYRPVALNIISSDEEGNHSGQDSRDLKIKKRISNLSPVGDLSKIADREFKSSNGEGASSSKSVDPPDSNITVETVNNNNNTSNSPIPTKSEMKPADPPQTEVSSVPTPSSSTNAVLKHSSMNIKQTTSTFPSSSTSSSFTSAASLHPSVVNSSVSTTSVPTSVVISSSSSSLNTGASTSGSSVISSQSAPVSSSQSSNFTTPVTSHSSSFVHTPVVTSVSSTITSSRPRTSESVSISLQPLPPVPTPDTNMEKDKDKNRKMRRSGPRSASGSSTFGDADSMHSNDDSHSKDFALTISEEKNLTVENREKASGRLQASPDDSRLNVQYTPNASTQASRVESFVASQAEFGKGETVKRPRSQDRGRRTKRGSVSKRGRMPGSSKDHLSKDCRDSDASSPDSFTTETIPAPKRGRTKKSDSKESLTSIVTNGLGATTLLLGNQINPASAVAQKMTDTLHAELEAHSIYKEEEKLVNTLIGPALPGKRETSTPGAVIGSTQPPPLPQSLEQLLERQWEQGSQFLMEQAQHFDIASLLSCLHQLRQENVRLEETVSSLIARRDHLLAVNARLSVPLTSTTSQPVQLSSSSTPTTPALHPPVTATPPAPPSGPSPVTITPTLIGHQPHSVAAISSQHNLGSLSSRSHPQGRHPSGGNPHLPTGPNPTNTISVRGTSPHDRRVGPGQISLPLENGLGEPEYRFRGQNTAGDHHSRQQSPMLPPNVQGNPPTMRQSPSSSNYHPSSSPHTTVPALSPSNVSHAPPPPPPHTLVTHSSHGGMSHAPIMVSAAHGSIHTGSLSRAAPDHSSRAELVRLGSGQPHSNPAVGYPVYQMVSPPVPGPGPHHSPVGLSQHPPPHAQVMRRDVVDTGRGGGSSMEKR